MSCTPIETIESGFDWIDRTLLTVRTGNEHKDTTWKGTKTDLDQKPPWYVADFDQGIQQMPDRHQFHRYGLALWL